MAMIMSVLSASVDPERVQELTETFQANLADAGSLIHRAYLAKDNDDDQQWRIVLVWKSQEAIDDYVGVIGPPPDAQTFLSVGATPNPSVSEVVSHWTGS